MCELFFAYKLNGKLDDNSIIELLKFARYEAYQHSDGFGVFRDNGKVYKIPKQFKGKHVKRVFNFCRGAKFIVAHIRTQTQGSKCYNNTHPFSKDNLLLAHNGSFSNLDHETKTDSEMCLDKIKKQKPKRTLDKIRQAFKDVEGWYSIFCYDNKNLYYFRDGADLHFCYVPSLNTIFGATEEDVLKGMFAELKLNVFWVRKYAKSYFEPKENIIYKIDDRGLTKVGEVEVSNTTTSCYGKSSFDEKSLSDMAMTEEGLWNQEDLNAYSDMWKGCKNA